MDLALSGMCIASCSIFNFPNHQVHAYGAHTLVVKSKSAEFTQSYTYFPLIADVTNQLD